MHFIDAPNNFYLGARVDPDTHTIIREDVVYYDARDLTTHGVILGMTGSGKTGLGITLLEEAALDGIPLLIIDPKGDITNMMLAFNDLTPENFKPWVNPEHVSTSAEDLDELAAAAAQKWKAGLAEWGIDNERIQDYRRSGRFSIYTPGSEAGLQVSILQSFAAPRQGWEGNEEVLREEISGIVTAVLALIGINAKPVEDREHILLSNIFEHNWRLNTDLSMEQLILQVQRPPFSKLGVMDVETIFPEKDRFKLAQALNNIIAAPNFQNWIKGEAIDISSLLYTEDGFPRTTIFYIAHLNDSERQFILTLLLNTIVTWMRQQAGSPSLRALLYIDEVFGMFPPHPYNPPTKEPIMQILKQARAFGLGTIVATQNPKDIDYKGLSNIGTWFIGKLQTDNDKQRVLEGLDSARDATSALDIKDVDKLISRIGPREFIMHNIHEPATPILMMTRWAMSYLRGPLTRDEISRLMVNQREAFYAAHPDGVSFSASGTGQQAISGGAYQIPSQQGPSAHGIPASQRPGAPPADWQQDAPSQAALAPPPAKARKEEIPAGFSAAQPVLPSSVHQYFLPVEFKAEQAVRQWEVWMRQGAVNVEPAQRILYRPAMLAQSVVRFADSKTNTYETFYYAFVVPNLPRVPFLNWEEYMTDPFDPNALDPDPFAKAYFAEMPPELSSTAGFKELKSNLEDWVYHNIALWAYHNPALKMYSVGGEDRQSFVGRVQTVARERRDAEVDKVALRYEKKLATLETRWQKQKGRVSSESDELRARKQEEMITAGESLFQLMKGRAYYTLSRTSRMRRYTEQTQDQLEYKSQVLQDLEADFYRTEEEMQRSLQSVQDKWTNVVQSVEEIKITPFKKDINLMLFGIGWVPYWDVKINGQQTVLPASSSGLSQAQEPSVGADYYTGSSGGGHDDQGGYRPSGGRAGGGY